MNKTSRTSENYKVINYVETYKFVKYCNNAIGTNEWGFCAIKSKSFWVTYFELFQQNEKLLELISISGFNF